MGCLTQNVDFWGLQAVPGPDSCTIGPLSSRAIHWYRPQVQQPPDGHTSPRQVQGGLLLSLPPPPFSSFFLSFPLLPSPFFLLPPFLLSLYPMHTQPCYNE